MAAPVPESMDTPLHMNQHFEGKYRFHLRVLK
jgi:hypothetical protein